MVKFRTMVRGAEDQLDRLVDLEELEEPAFKIANDPRVTRIGRSASARINEIRRDITPQNDGQ